MDMRRTIIPLAVLEGWDRFVFYGVLTLLLLMLQHHYGFSLSHAYALWGVYIALGFSLPVVGGIVADRFLGVRASILLGSLLVVFGCLLLGLMRVAFLYPGLAVLLSGIGLIKGNVSVYVGERFKARPDQKDQCYQYFFMGMATGALAGPVVFGLFASQFGWSYGFVFTAVAMALSLLITLVLDKSLYAAIQIKSLVWVAAVVLLAWLVLRFSYQGEWAVTLATVLAVLSVGWFTFHGHREAVNPVVGLVLLALLTAVFYTASFQIDGSMIQLIRYHLLHHLYGFTIPASSFASLEPLMALLFSPLLAKFWGWLDRRHITCMTVWVKVCLGLVFAAMALWFFALAAEHAVYSDYSLLVLLIGNIVLGFANAVVVPASMAAVSCYAPGRIVSTMMGVMFMATAVAGYFSSHIMMRFMVHGALTLPGYVHGYKACVWLLLFTAAVGFLIAPLVQKLLLGRVKYHDVPSS